MCANKSLAGLRWCGRRRRRPPVSILGIGKRMARVAAASQVTLVLLDRETVFRSLACRAVVRGTPPGVDSNETKKQTGGARWIRA